MLFRSGTNGQDILGQNIFRCTSADGHYSGYLKSQGNQDDDRFAKQFAGNDNLKAIGDWYYAVGANIGDQIRVTWITPNDIVIEKI